MTSHVNLQHCIECGERTDNRSLICDGCAPEYADARTHNEDDAGALLERGAWKLLQFKHGDSITIRGKRIPF